MSNIAFWGTPELATTILDRLVEGGHTPQLIVTAPDAPQGRKMELTAPPTKIWAEKNNVDLLQPEKLDKDFENILKEEGPWDLFIVVAYGKILPKSIIDMPKQGTINIHYSLLPKYRGAAPVEAAILAGEKETGVTIQKMEQKLDTGGILFTKNRSIDDTITAPELKTALTADAGELLSVHIQEILSGAASVTNQEENLATYCKKITKEDGEINLLDEATLNYRKYRAYYGWPGTYFFVTRGHKKIRILIRKAELESGQFIIKRVVPEGKKEMDYETFLKS